MSVLDEATIETLAERLWRAASERRVIGRVSDEHPGMDAADAYRVQQALVRRRMTPGVSVVGWKLGLTSAAMQQQLGVGQPDYGPILSDFLVPDGGSIRTADLIQPRVEAEIAFVLRSTLRGPGVTRDDVLAASAGLRPAIEVIDSRIEAWRITLADTICDMASSARVVVGPDLIPLDGFDVRLVGCVLERSTTGGANGPAPGSAVGPEVVGTGAGAAALGDPAVAVAWAANTLGELGVALEPGHLIMTGALHASVPVRPGDVFTARFDRLGTVSVRFE